MKIIHFTFHCGCQTDLEYVCKQLNITLDTISVSDDTASNDKYNVYPEKSKYYYQKYKDLIKDYDAILISDTSPLARPWLEFQNDKPLIVWVCNRFDYSDAASLRSPFPDKEFYEHYNQKKNNVIFIGYTAFELYYAKLKNVDLGNLIIKPIGKRDYNLIYPKIDQYFITTYHNDDITERECRQLNLNFSRERYSTPRELTKYKAIIHFPYAWSNLALFENLQEEIIYIIPSEKLLDQYSIFWSPPFIREQLHLSEWYSDEYREFFIYIDSWEQILDITDQIIENKRQHIREWKDKHVNEVLEKWTTVFKLENLVSDLEHRNPQQ